MELVNKTNDYSNSYFPMPGYNTYKFSNCPGYDIPTKNLEYRPIFGVGCLDETRIFCITARPIKIIKEALEYYDLASPYDYDGMVGKTVGIIKRIKVDGIKKDEYHCVKYLLKEIKWPEMYSCSSVVVRPLEGGEDIEINTIRVTAPKLYDIVS